MILKISPIFLLIHKYWYHDFVVIEKCFLNIGFVTLNMCIRFMCFYYYQLGDLFLFFYRNTVMSVTRLFKACCYFYYNNTKVCQKCVDVHLKYCMLWLWSVTENIQQNVSFFIQWNKHSNLIKHGCDQVLSYFMCDHNVFAKETIGYWITT